MENFWSGVLAFNSLLWFIALAFLANGFGMLIIALDWKRFVLALAIFIALSLSELTITALIHD